MGRANAVVARRVTFTASAAIVVALVLTGTAMGAPVRPDSDDGASRALVFFTRGEQLAKVPRDVEGLAPLDEALAALVAGPTEGERERGLRSSVPVGTTLHGTDVSDGVALIDLSGEFAGGTRTSLHARLAQLVFTATQFEDVTAVRVAIDGELLTRLGAIALDPPPGRVDFFAPASGGPPPEISAPLPPPSRLVRAIQQRLIELSYLPAGAADGIAGPQTQQAILAFQGWERIARDGRATRQLRDRLKTAARPRPRSGGGRYVEVRLARQVALLVVRGRVTRTVHVSTGKRGHGTPRGSYRVFRKERMSWSVPYRVWLPWASYFTGGIAFHESDNVPAYPASHGCVRVHASDSRLVYNFTPLGTRVFVR